MFSDLSEKNVLAKNKTFKQAHISKSNLNKQITNIFLFKRNV